MSRVFAAVGVRPRGPPGRRPVRHHRRPAARAARVARPPGRRRGAEGAHPLARLPVLRRRRARRQGADHDRQGVGDRAGGPLDEVQPHLRHRDRRRARLRPRAGDAAHAGDLRRDRARRPDPAAGLQGARHAARPVADRLRGRRPARGDAGRRDARAAGRAGRRGRRWSSGRSSSTASIPSASTPRRRRDCASSASRNGHAPGPHGGGARRDRGGRARPRAALAPAPAQARARARRSSRCRSCSPTSSGWTSTASSATASRAGWTADAPHRPGARRQVIPSRSSSASSARQERRTRTDRSRCTRRPISRSISLRAAVPIALDHAPARPDQDALLGLRLGPDRGPHGDELARVVDLLDLHLDGVRDLLAGAPQHLLAHHLGQPAPPRAGR